MLSTEYLLAKFGFDTAENGPQQVRKFELSEILNLHFEISKFLFAAQWTLGIQLAHQKPGGVVPRGHLEKRQLDLAQRRLTCWHSSPPDFK